MAADEPEGASVSISELERALREGRLSRRDFARRALALGASAPVLAALLDACRGPARSHQPAGTVDLPEPMGPIERELAIYNWSDYVAPNTIADFEKEFGVEVTYDVYESNEEMLAKLLAGASGYDLVFPTGYAVEVLIATGLAAPIEKRVLTNWGNLAALFLDRSFDPGNRYTVPYQWGVTGYAYRTDRISPAPDSWDVLWDTRYAGKMTQLDDGREGLTPFLLMRGYSLNSVNPSQLEEAKIDAIRAKKNIKAYIAAPVKGQLISGDVWLAQLWNGDATQAKLEQPSIGYVIPREGCSIWEDSLVIPRHASHKRAAHEFVNYILRADVGAAISDTTGYGSPNVAAVARMEHPVPFPTDEEMKRLEFQKDLGKATALVDQIYTEIKAE